MVIRQLTAQDAVEYRKIRLEGLKNNPEAFASSYEEERDSSVDQYKSRLQSDQSYTFGAYVDNQLIGVVTLVKETKKKLKHKASIVAMYVSPRMRGLRIGNHLMRTAIDLAKHLEEIEQVNLAVVTTNESAKRLYSSLGFSTFGVEKRALKVGQSYLDEEHIVLFL